jgi:hypothetical protein
MQVFFIVFVPLSAVKAQKSDTPQIFISELDTLRASLNIPGMAIAIAKVTQLFYKPDLVMQI